MEIYADVLIIINFYVNYFLIRASCLFLRLDVKNRRLIFAAFAGALSALVIFLPQLGFFLSFLLKAIICGGIVLLFAGFGGIKRYIKNCFVFLCVNFVFAGFMSALYWFFAPLSMVYRNGVAYLDISFVFLVVSTACAYAVIRFARYIIDTRFSSSENYILHIRFGDSEKRINALCDSGNSLCDRFSGLPVIIVDYAEILDILPNDILLLLDGETDGDLPCSPLVRYIPYSTISGSSLIPAVKADMISLCCAGREKQITALVGISKQGMPDSDAKAIFNPKLLI